MTDNQFNELVATCCAELIAKQQGLEKHLHGNASWFYDLERLELKVDESLLSIVPVGTFCRPRGTWLWAWANESFPKKARNAACEIKKLHDITGFRVFLDEGMDASIEDVEIMLALSVHVLEADAFFRIPDDETTLFLGVRYSSTPGQPSSPDDCIVRAN